MRRLCKDAKFKSPLHCKNSTNDTVIVAKTFDQQQMHTVLDYGLTSKSDDVYLWRKGLCLNESVEFEIRCTFAVEPWNCAADKVPFTLI
uniref:DUF7808 domain-containing protein n=1 Tax=Ditylenchus dipsaci TaxID=166011 RepID=A0A915DAS1_9BILA